MHTVELSAGTIEYDAYGPAKGRSVVFVHGYAMGASLWRPLAQRLAEHSLRCFAPTWPLGGHRRAMRPAAELTMRGVAAMVDEFLTALDLDDVVLVGNDTGGAIAQIVAGEFGDRVGALVLTSCDAFEHFPPPILAPLITATKVPPVFRAALKTMGTKIGRRRAYGALSHGDLDALTAEWTRRLVRDPGIAEDLRRFTASEPAEHPRRGGQAAAVHQAGTDRLVGRRRVLRAGGRPAAGPGAARRAPGGHRERADLLDARPARCAGRPDRRLRDG